MGGSSGLFADQVLTLLVIDDHVGGAQLGGIVIGPGNLDLTVGMKTMPHGRAARVNSVDFERHHFAVQQGDDGR